ncbi:MAG: M67 family metallopeptidase [Chloroflexi bacterium]|nr:M67 family metallopeptidase [Chloroflexota bacterium]
MVAGTDHPGPASVGLSQTIREAIIAHARAEDPNEACGLIIGDRPAGAGGRALRFEATANEAASPYRYEIPPAELYRLSVAVDDADQSFWGIVHSHTHTPAVPSATDIGLAFYPDALYVLVSLAEDERDPATGAPGIRAWRIVGGSIHEVPVEKVATKDAPGDSASRGRSARR